MKKVSVQSLENMVKRFNTTYPEGSKFKYLSNNGSVETYTVQYPAIVFREKAVVRVFEYGAQLNIAYVIY